VRDDRAKRSIASQARADEYERHYRMLHDFAALVVAAVLGAILFAFL